MNFTFQIKHKGLKKEKEEMKKFWKEQFEELSRKQLRLPMKLYQL